MADAADPRPLSPYVTVWRWHITMAVSILHRVAGVILYAGAAGLVVWLGAIALGPSAYNALMSLAPPWLIEIKILAVTGVLAFHLANGLRHLVWDIGAGFKPKTASTSAWAVILIALAAPVALYFVQHR